jgi:hypothetical protein
MDAKSVRLPIKNQILPLRNSWDGIEHGVRHGRLIQKFMVWNRCLDKTKVPHQGLFYFVKIWLSNNPFLSIRILFLFQKSCFK